MTSAPIPRLDLIPAEVKAVVERETDRVFEAIAADRRRPVFEFNSRTADDIFAELDRSLG